MQRVTDLLKNKKIWTALFFVVLLLSVVLVQKKYDSQYARPLSIIESSTSYLFPEKILPYLSFGFTNLIADYYWINAIQDMNLRSTNIDLYLSYFYNISALDPKFAEPYSFAIYVIPSKHATTLLDYVLPLAERGMVNLPNNWQIPYYLGFQYQLVKKSYTDALHYISIAAIKPNAPQEVVSAYRGYLARSIRDDKVDSTLIKVILKTSENQNLKNEVRKDLAEEYFTKVLEHGIIQYKIKYREYPNRIEDLVKKKFVTLPIDFFEKLSVDYNKWTGTVLVTFK